MRKLLASLVLMGVAASGGASAVTYEANWESLDRREVPAWWTEAKFGVFVHWGPYSVPAYAPTNDDLFGMGYAEWYQGRLLKGYRVFLDHHAKKYNSMPYENFACQFTAENFDPNEWARLFRASGAKYVVLTSKHHDGYALWPSPESGFYNSTVLGSGRDLAGEFAEAMKKAGLKRGFYFSLLEHANPCYPKNLLKNGLKQAWSMDEWATRINIPQLKELVEDYEADIVWADGEWDYTDKEQHAEEFLAWLYNESKVKESVVVNDRWGSNVRGKHGGHFTTEYAFAGGDTTGLSQVHPWEECRGIGKSFGFNRYETALDYMSREECLETLVRIVSEGGNLLLNVGPTADGRIPAIMQDRLLAIGKWLETNGEAIYATTRWPHAKDAASLPRVYFTEKGENVYAIIFGAQAGEIRFNDLGKVESVELLGSTRPVVWRYAESGLVVMLTEAVPSESAITYKFVRTKESRDAQ